MACELPARLRTPSTSAEDDARRGNRITTIVAGALGWRQYPLDYWLCTLELFFVTVGCAILGAPSPKLLETAVCRQHFQRDDPPDELCKSTDVQVHFALVLTILSTFSTLAATAMQIPMGFIVDKRSRRLALVLNTISTVLYWGFIAVIGTARAFPIWCFYLAPLFILLGGGPWATGALVFAAVNDRVRPEQRTMAFSIMEAVSGIADLIGPIIGTLTMATHILVPFLLATVLFSLMFIPVFYLSNNSDANVRDTSAEDSALLPSESTSLLGNSASPDCDTPNRVPSTEELFRSKSAIFITCFASFFLFYLARDSSNYLIPWVALRFHEPMAHAGLLFSLRAIVSSILYLTLLPLATSWPTRTGEDDVAARDLTLSAAGVFFSAAGTLALALAPNMVVVAAAFTVAVLGSGVTVTLRSFVASGADPASSGRLFTAISTAGTAGSLVGMPIMGALYSWGIGNVHQVFGLPFLVSAISYLLILGLLLCLLIKR